MAKQLQIRGGTTAQHSVFTGAIREITVDTDKDTIVVHDGTTVGGFPLARESALNTHIARTDNPHVVTKAQVGLGNAENTADADKVVASAGKLTTSRTISLSGDATGSVSFDGSANVNVVVAVGNDTHTHAFGNITSKPTTLAGYGITDAATITHNHSGTYEPVITAGTTAQYLRGDKTWQIMPTSLPASDVYAWAKAGTKPSYTYNEVGAPSTTGTGASGTWGIGITGNAGTATKLTNSSGDWSGSGAIANVVGMLSWKNYGNGHTIFDASQGTAPNGTAVNNTNPTSNWSPSYPTLMGWNGANTHGVRVDSARVADSCGNAANADKLIGKNWYWSGQGGQPTWLWGGSDGTNMYVYNPSNFSVYKSEILNQSRDPVFTELLPVSSTGTLNFRDYEHGYGSYTYRYLVLYISSDEAAVNTTSYFIVSVRKNLPLVTRPSDGRLLNPIVVDTISRQILGFSRFAFSSSATPPSTLGVSSGSLSSKVLSVYNQVTYANTSVPFYAIWGTNDFVF